MILAEARFLLTDMNPNDYDEDGNNIVPCPICLSAHCPGKEGGKCPEEDEYATSMNKTPIQQLLERSKEEFDALFFLRTRTTKDDAWIESLIRKAYLLGLERAKECLPGRGIIEEKQGYDTVPKGELERAWNIAIEETEKALDSAIGEV